MMKRKQRRKEAIKKVEKKEKIKDKATQKNSQQKVNYATDPKCLSQQSQVATKKL